MYLSFICETSPGALHFYIGTKTAALSFLFLDSMGLCGQPPAFRRAVNVISQINAANRSRADTYIEQTTQY